MKIVILVAMDKEFGQLKGLLDGANAEEHSHYVFVKGTMGKHEVTLMKCGIGKVNAAVGAAVAIEAYRPDLVVSSGCAGGADTTLHVADCVVASACAYHDVYCGSEVTYGQVMGMPATFVTPQNLVEKALALNNEPAETRLPHVRSGLTVTGDWFVDSREKMQTIVNNFPDATAVDMESCAIAQACHIMNVPFVSFRMISDVPLTDHHAGQYFDFWENIAQYSFEVTRHFIESL